MSLKVALAIGIGLLLLLAVVLMRRQASVSDDGAGGAGRVAGQASAHPELEFFNEIGGELRIELDADAKPVANLQNLAAAPGAKITRLSLQADLYDEAADDARALTAEERGRVAFRGATIRLRGEGKSIVEHRAPNGASFTVGELLDAVEETERRTRGESEWLGGIDVHHIYFEGLHPADDGVWEIRWGS